MMENCKTYLAIVLCFALTVTPLQAPAMGTASFGGSRPFGGELDRQSTLFGGSPLDSASGGIGLGSGLPNARTQTFEVAELGTREITREGRFHSISGQSSTLLPDGRLLLLGGQDTRKALASAFIKDPTTGAVTQLRPGMQRARYAHSATVLPDGTVLVLGGVGADGTIERAAELFDLASLTFTTVSVPGITPRAFHSATLLTDGRVLVAGGVTANGQITELLEFWDRKTMKGSPSNSQMITARGGHTATLQADGSVLFWGGMEGNGLVLDYGEVYDPMGQQMRMQATPPIQNDTDALLVEDSIPQDKEQNVALDAVVAVRFSRALRVTSVNMNTVTLTGPEGNVAVKVVSAEAGMLAFVSPHDPLLPATSYLLTLSGATDLSGSALPDTTLTFTTAGDSAPGQSGTNGSDKAQSNPFDSHWRKLPPLMAPPGVTAVSGQVLRLNGEPLKNTTLQIGDLPTRTDGTGRFLLAAIPSGHQVMWIIGTSANTGGTVYGVYEDGVDIKPKQTNVLNYTIWMTALDMAHAADVPSPTINETIVSSPLLPGLELHLPAGTVIKDRNDKVVTQVSITSIPVTQPPFPLPKRVQVPIYFTIQPGGAYLEGYGQNSSVGARLFYPNPGHQVPGTMFNFWDYDADQKGWFVYGQGSVSADGRQVVPNPGVVIYEFTGAMVGGGGPGGGPPLGGGATGGSAGDPVDLQTGLFVYSKTDMFLPDVIPINLVRTYRPMDSASHAFGIGTTLNYDSIVVGDTNPYTYIDVIMPDGGRLHFDRTSPGTSWTDAVYEHTTSPTGYYGAQIAWSGAAFGGQWILTTKDGTKYFFPECAGGVGNQCALRQIVDRYGNTVTLTRDGNSNLTQITSPNGRWLSLTYDTSNRVTQATDNSGRSVHYSYDSSGRLHTFTDANGGITTYNYDSSNNMTTIQDARGIVYLTNYYDSNNRVYKQVQADSSTYLFSYITGGAQGCIGGCPISGSNVIETDVTDPRGSVRKILFNSDGYVTSTIFAYGQPEQQTISYVRQSGSAVVTSATDAFGRHTSYAYDSLGNVTNITRLATTPNAVTTSFAYEPKFSALTTVTDPLGRTTSFNHDNNGNLIGIVDPSGVRTSASFNSAGQPVSITDPAGNTVQISYSGGDAVGITDSLGRTATAFTDGAGRQLSITDPAGQTTQIAWNALNRVTSTTDPRGNTTNFVWDPNGHLLSLQDGNHNTTSYTYDNMDRVATRTDPLLVQESFLYDGNDNLIQFTDRRGIVTTYNYDSLNRLGFVGYGTQSGPTYQSTININYDVTDRPTSIVDSLSGMMTPVFDGLDRLTSETTPQGSVSYQYDAAGREVSMTVGGQTPVTYSYDNSDRLIQILQGTSTVSFAYDAAGRRTSLTLPNGVVASYGYDNASELTSISYQNSAGVLGNLSYTYDQAGRAAQLGGGFARTGLPAALSSATYDAANRLTNWAGTSYSYDANGNLLSDGVNGYVWDARNQLSSISGAVNASFQYDALGHRAGKTIGGVAANFLFDGSNTVQELSGSTPTANLLTGGLDEIFTRTSGGVENYLTDPLGSTVATTDSTGALATQYTYEPFGNTSSTGSPTSNAFQYTGRENDGTGLYFNRARYYSPRLQRFISQDPMGFGGGDTNLYAYTFNNPTNLTDPSGNGPWELAGAGGTGVGVFIGASQFVPGWDLVLDSGLVLGAVGFGAVALSKDAAKDVDSALSLPVAISTPMDPNGRGPSQDPGKKKKDCYDQNDIDDANHQYPKKAGKFQDHHRIPQFLNGTDADGLHSLPSAYHQLITNAWKTQFGYRGDPWYNRPGEQTYKDFADELEKQFPLEPCE